MSAALQELLAAGLVASALVLLVAGLAKVRDRRTFGHQIAAYDIVPAAASVVLGQILPFIEVAAAAALVFVPRLGGPAAALLFATFALAVGINLARGRSELVCACFGAGGRHRISIWHVAGNTLFAGVVVLAAVTAVHRTLASVVLGVTLLLIVAVVRAVDQARPAAYRLSPPKEV